MDKGAIAVRYNASKKKKRAKSTEGLAEGSANLDRAPTIHDPHSCCYCFWKCKKSVRAWYNGKPVQLTIAALIFLNFVMNCIKYSYIEDDSITEPFYYSELVFAVIFLFELLINMYAHWFRKFALDWWNWFDFVVVTISIVAIVMPDVPGVTALRLVRAFRVFKMFRSIQSMRQIIRALEEGLGGVCAAFFILILVISLYAIMGVEFFRHIDILRDSYDTAYFGSFFEALYTLFQVMTGDSWNEAIGRKVARTYPVGGPLFFISYILIATIMLLNVAVAFLLAKMFDVKAELDMAEDHPYSCQIRINSAHGLPKMDLLADGDPYVKITTFRKEGPEEDKNREKDIPEPMELEFQTTVVKNSRNPVWQEVKNAQATQPFHKIRFELYDWENWFKVKLCRDSHDFIGAVEVDLEEKLYFENERIHRDLQLVNEEGVNTGTLSIDLLPDTTDDDVHLDDIMDYLRDEIHPDLKAIRAHFEGVPPPARKNEKNGQPRNTNSARTESSGSGGKNGEWAIPIKRERKGGATSTSTSNRKSPPPGAARTGNTPKE